MGLQLQPSHSSSSSSWHWEYDVFLNFRGPDTRYGFTGYLYKALCDKGIHAFMDFDDIHRGNEISASLMKAIEASRIAILVFSKNYAESSYCLNELVKIMECSQRHGQFVLPVFYSVDPSVVRHQKGIYEEALAKTGRTFEHAMDRVQRWRTAMADAANLSGLHFKGDGYGYEFVEKIVEQVSRVIKRVGDYPVELESQEQASYSSLAPCLSNGWKYDVFLSFRGTDTRFGFTGNLYNVLCGKGIHTFMDDEALHRGNEISGTLDKAIEGSKIAILVFSKNYAYSSYCLDELVKIMKCSQSNSQCVLPVFYNVDPPHVRHQRGSYEEALAKHEERFKNDVDRLRDWRAALHQAANLTGFHFKGNEYEHEFIGKIVRVVSRNIRNIASPVVGIHENGGTEAESLLQDNQRNTSKVKAETEANVENFMEVDVFEKSVCVQLESLKRKKRELEGEIRAINDQITEFQRKTVAKRKKAFDSGKNAKLKSIVT
ncbi:uncharacterized protein LOC107489826 isoform X2 [Arachis duranensis]|uniref:Uncharacterized protein LOC107489826 isoform X2 n=1 Tax=Arachis duranensis TaxID=130453 RepID=A0A6P4DKP2_ARADU|nr:uncharacterized protein LOC107489826 isoform X2 [Arachis duranensis]